MDVDSAATEAGQFEDADVEHWWVLPAVKQIFYKVHGLVVICWLWCCRSVDGCHHRIQSQHLGCIIWLETTTAALLSALNILLFFSQSSQYSHCIRLPFLPVLVCIPVDFLLVCHHHLKNEHCSAVKSGQLRLTFEKQPQRLRFWWLKKQNLFCFVAFFGEGKFKSLYQFVNKCIVFVPVPLIKYFHSLVGYYEYYVIMQSF